MRRYDDLNDIEREELDDRVMERIKYTTESINSSVSFAESKNAALLVLDFSLIWAFLPTEHSPLSDKLITVGLFIALLLACFSFYPRIFVNPNRGKTSSDDVNLVFFRDLAKLDTAEYLRLLYRLEKIDVSNAKKPLPKISQWLADSIIVNSGISIIKYRCFKRALIATIAICVIKIILLLFR